MQISKEEKACAGRASTRWWDAFARRANVIENDVCALSMLYLSDWEASADRISGRIVFMNITLGSPAFVLAES